MGWMPSALAPNPAQDPSPLAPPSSSPLRLPGFPQGQPTAPQLASMNLGYYPSATGAPAGFSGAPQGDPGAYPSASSLKNPTLYT